MRRPGRQEGSRPGIPPAQGVEAAVVVAADASAAARLAAEAELEGLTLEARWRGLPELLERRLAVDAAA